MKTFILVSQNENQSTTLLAIRATTLQEAAEKLGLEKAGTAPTKAFAPGVESATVRPTSSCTACLSNVLGIELETDFLKGVQAGWIIGFIKSSGPNELLLGEIRTCP